jgi:DNA-binding transcriptional regulator YhcF (GntR family)
MNHISTSYKQMAKSLGVPAKELKKAHKSLIAKGYIKELGNGSSFLLTHPDPNMAKMIHCSPIRLIK